MWKNSLEMWKEFWQKKKNVYNLEAVIYKFSEIVKFINS